MKGGTNQEFSEKVTDYTTNNTVCEFSVCAASPFSLQYLVGHQVLTFCLLSRLPMCGHHKGSVPHIILQQPLEGLTFVLSAKLNRTPAQNEPIVTRVSALGENAGLRFSLHLLWPLWSSLQEPLAGRVALSLPGAFRLHLPG